MPVATARQAETVRAEPRYAKGDSVIYSPSCGDHEFMARVVTAHRDGSVTIEVQWLVRAESLTMGYFGDHYRIDPQHISSRTAAGTPVGRVKHVQAAS